MKKRTLTRTPALLALMVGLAACGPGDPPARLQWEVGRELVYEITDRTVWPGDPPFVKEVVARCRMRCGEHAAGGRGVWMVQLERLSISAPTRMGVAVDTTTPEAEPGDRHDTEPLVRKLLGTETRLVLDPMAFPADIQAVPEIMDPVKAWAQEAPEERAALGMEIAKLVDAAVLTGISFQAAAVCLPASPAQPGGSTFHSPARQLAYLAGVDFDGFDVTLSRPAANRVVVRGNGALAPAGGDLVSTEQPVAAAEVEILAELDAERGVFLSIDVDATLTLRDPGGSGRTLTVKQELAVRLIDEE